MNTKKLTIIVLLLALLYYFMQFSIIYFKSGHHVTYYITDAKKMEVDEVYKRRNKGEKDNYILTIKVDDLEFSIQVFEYLKKRNYIIKDIKYYEDLEYKCIYPIFKNNMQYKDIICYDGDNYKNYTSIKGKDKKLDEYVNKLPNYKSYDKASNIKDLDNIKIYTDNLISKHSLSLENYKGLYLIGKNKTKNIKLFDEDEYSKEVHAFNGRNYIVADYNKDYTFDRLYEINVKDGKKKVIKINKDISFDSYTMGVVDDDVYIFDLSNKKQYRIKKDDIEFISKKENILNYKNGRWEDMNVYKAVDIKPKFSNYQVENDKYERVDKVGKKLSGYYYYYEKTKKGYNLYRANIQDKDKLLFIENISNIDNVYYIDEFVYFKKDDKIMYYSDYTGLQTVIENNELKYNETLLFGVSK